MTDRDAPRPARGRWIRRILLAVVGLTAAGLAVFALSNSSDELLAAADALTSLNYWWVGLAVIAEIVSYLARGEGQALVLRRGTAGPSVPSVPAGPAGPSVPDGPRPGAVVMGATALAGDAAAYCLPFGFAASGVVIVRALGKRGVRAALATWTFTVAHMFYVGAVGVLTLIAIAVAGDHDPVPGLGAASLSLVLMLLSIGTAVVVGRRSRAVRAAYGRLRRRLRRREATLRMATSRGRSASALVWVARWWRSQTGQLRSARLSAWSAAAILGWMLISWLTDIAVLAIAYPALGSTPPWLGLLLAYCAGQIAAAMPITPGGLGAVEGSLTLALVAFGGTETVALAAVLLYRVIAYWGCVPAGLLAWIALRPRSSAVPVSTEPMSELVEGSAA